VSAWATSAEMVVLDSRARAGTRATRVLGSLTVNTLVSFGHDDPPGRRDVFAHFSRVDARTTH
jgi:hypothetical protein